MSSGETVLLFLYVIFVTFTLDTVHSTKASKQKSNNVIHENSGLH